MLSLSAGYLLQRVDYAGAFRNGLSAPSLTAAIGRPVTSWAAAYLGGGVLFAGALQMGTAGQIAQFGTARTWGGRGLAGCEISVLRAPWMTAALRLEGAYTHTGEATIRGTRASMRHLGASGQLVASF